jgi:hypothetical protein
MWTYSYLKKKKMKMQSIIFYLLFMCIISPNIQPDINLNSTKKIIFLTDIHLDILYDSNSSNNNLIQCKNSKDYLSHFLKTYDYGRYNCNPTEIILKSALNDMKNKIASPDLLILGGDLIAHNLYKFNISNNSNDKTENKKLYKQTFQKIYDSIRVTFPNVKILSLIGNNDFYEHYDTPDESTKLEQEEYFKNIFLTNNNNNLATDFNSDFPLTIANGMYYSFYSNDLDTKFIFLNSNQFSVKNEKFSESDADEQILWLEKELKLSAGINQKVFILMHIPLYPHYFENTVNFMLREAYVKKMEEIGFRYRKNIINYLSGHTHWSKFGVRLNYKNENDIKEHFPKFLEKKNIIHPDTKITNNETFLSNINFPSLTPVYFNNPGYSIISFDRQNRHITNIENHYADLKETLDDKSEYSLNLEIKDLWKFSYNFKNDFNFDKFDSGDFSDFISKRLEDKDTMQKYLLYISGYNKDASVGEISKYMDYIKTTGNIDAATATNILSKNMFICSHKILFSSEIDKC